MINIRIILFLLLGTIGLFLLLRYQGAPLKTKAAPAAIVSLEFANTPERISAVRDAWETNELIQRSRTNIWIDFLFIPFYAMLFYTLCGSISVRMQGFPAKLGIFLAFGALIAGVSDLLENILMLFALHGHFNTASAFLMTAFASLKFILLGLAALYVIPLGLRLILLKAIAPNK